VLRQKLMVLQLIKREPIFYGAKIFITVFARECNLSLSRNIGRLRHPHSFQIYFNIILQSAIMSFKVISSLQLLW